MSSLLKAGLVSLLVASGGLGPSGSSLLCSAEFNEFDELESAASAAQPNVAPAKVEPVAEAAATADQTGATAAAGSDDAGGDDDRVANDGGVDDEFSSSPSKPSKAAPARRPGGSKKKSRSAEQVNAAGAGGADAGAGAGGGAGGPKSPQEPPGFAGFQFYEYMALAGVAGYVTNFFLGRRANDQKATAWAKRNVNVLREHFFQVGPYSSEDLDILIEAGHEVRGLLTKYSQNQFKLYATCVRCVRESACVRACMRVRCGHESACVVFVATVFVAHVVLIVFVAFVVVVVMLSCCRAIAWSRPQLQPQHANNTNTIRTTVPPNNKKTRTTNNKSGNDFMRGLNVELVLKTRQDLFAVLRGMAETVDDIVRLDVALEDDEVRRE
jgi:hypothetical protein